MRNCLTSRSDMKISNLVTLMCLLCLTILTVCHAFGPLVMRDSDGDSIIIGNTAVHDHDPMPEPIIINEGKKKFKSKFKKMFG